MRLAVISDIHGNLYALMKAFEDIDAQGVDSIICLGDLVGYGAHPNEVIALIRKKGILCLKGNYDASVVDGDFTYIRDTSINSFSLPWTCKELRESNKFYLANLPTSLTLEIEGKQIKFVHGSPNLINEYLIEDADNTNTIMNNLQEDVLVCAHTHLPSNKLFEDKLFVNCGSVGKPKIGIPKITYSILDIQADSKVKCQIRYVDYEYHKMIKDMEMLNFPSRLVLSYETGLE